MNKSFLSGAVLCGFFCVMANGQQFSYGVVGGSALTDDFNTRYVTSFDGYPIQPTLYRPAQRGFPMGGAMLEWHFSDSFSVEGDGLFRLMHFSVNGVTQQVGTWEIPVLAKYRLNGWDAGRSRVRPFIEGGPTLRISSGTKGTDPSRIGGSAGAGLEFHIQQWTLAPTLRYTRWRRDDANFGTPSTRPDQLEFLVGFSHTPDHLVRQFTQLHRVSVGALAGFNLLGDYGQSSQSYSESGTYNGTPYTYANSYSVSSGPRSFLPGGSVEFRLGKGLSVEWDFIFRPVREYYSSSVFSSSGTYPSTSFSSSSYSYSGDSSTNTWQYPILLKYKLPKPLPKTKDWVPFVESGAAFRASSQFSATGFEAGLGVTRRVGQFQLAPQLRYTRWGQQNYSYLKADELNLFLGISFR